MRIFKSPELLIIALISFITLSACENKKQKDYGYTNPLDTPVFQPINEQQTATIDSTDKIVSDSLVVIEPTDSSIVNVTSVNP